MSQVSLKSSLTLRERVARQFGMQLGNPRGILGAFVGRTVFAHGNAALNQWVVEQLPIAPAAQVLEVGCGPGVTLHSIRQHAPQGHVVGLDRSPVMVRQARQRNAEAIRAGAMEVREGNIAALPFAEAQFDLVVAIHVMYFWEDAVATLQELRRVIQPGGSIALGFALRQNAPLMSQRAFAQAGAQFPETTDAVVALLTQAGFLNARVICQETPEGIAGCCAIGQR